MAIKYFNIFQSKASQNFYPNWDFWFEKKPSGNPDGDPFLVKTKPGTEKGRRATEMTQHKKRGKCYN
jgi:hypothetical protein